MIAQSLTAEVRSSQEFQSAVVRMSIWLLMLPIMGLAGYVGDYDFTWGQFLLLFGVHLVWFAGLLISTLRRPQLWPGRTYLSIIADLSGTTGTIFLTGDATGPFYLLYAVSFLSQGMRYGKTNLLLASLGSVLAYTFVAGILGAWRSQSLEVMFITMVLVVLPAYEYLLLRKLQKATSVAETASRARGDFLATMTHELRTPLSGVIGMAGLLERTRLDDEQREYVESINTSAGVLQALIGDILDLSKIDAGKIEIRPETFALHASLVETCWALSNQALDKEIELVCRVAPDIPVLVTGDELRFRQILFNLVGNAVKFTDRGCVCITARRLPAAKGDDRELLQVEIRDTGIGIPAERVNKVFDNFWQADPTPTRRHGGTGLGTAIARELAQLMGGGIQVRSIEGEGSTFTVTLPFIDAAKPELPQAPRVLRGVEVLVIEQHSESAEAIAEICAAAGMRPIVLSAIDQLGALDQDGDGATRLVLIVDTPRGLDLARIRGLVGKLTGSGLPTVYVHYPRRKPLDDDGVAQRAVKPVDPLQLWLAMARTLAPDTEYELDEIDVAEQEPVPAVDGRILVAEDDDINARLIESLLTKAGCAVTLVRDGRAALDAAARETFDLALIDLRMPLMDGIEFARNLRRREAPGAHLPIVALTANAAEDARTECLDAGMDDFVTKPVDPEKLGAMIERYGVTGR